MIVLSYALATKNIFLTLIKTAIQCEFESEKEGQNLCETACSSGCVTKFLAFFFLHESNPPLGSLPDKKVKMVLLTDSFFAEIFAK